ncbi:MAG: NAD-dependent epimerase/dehydratase family protein [Chlorobi bacterium]|nr:NAD-dependent epimerase/dehydratase family protein [Chlorobiota bacterium]
MPVKSLIIGSGGQIGSELTKALREKYGMENVVITDIVDNPKDAYFYRLDATDKDKLRSLIEHERPDHVYLMAAILSAKAEQFPLRAWNINMDILFNVLELQTQGLFKRLFWPSSIAVFGPHTPKEHTPQYTVTDPNTVYGISKLAGERWVEYYHQRHGSDIRGIRYPGVLSWKVQPGGGTTDYAVEMFHYALRGEPYVCYLEPDQALPMIYIDDAIRATLELMEAPGNRLRVRSAYNVAGVSFTPRELAQAIRRYIPDFKVEYKPDFRQRIAASWPRSIDDTYAREDWGWQHRFDLDAMVREMLTNLRRHYYPDATLFPGAEPT